MKNGNQLTRDKLWTKDYIFVMIASICVHFCNYFFFATLPIFAQKVTGTAASSGFMMGTFAMAALVFRPISGMIIDKIGRTKTLIFGAVFCTIACLLYNFASGIIFLIVFRVVHGIGYGIHSTTAGTVAADVIPESRFTEGIGYSGLYVPIASALAPAIALTIIGNGQIEKFKNLFILAVVISLLSVLFDCGITYESKKKSQIDTSPDEENKILNTTHHNTAVVSNLPKTFLGFEYAAFLPFFVVLLVFFGQSSVTSFLALYALGNKMGNIGVFFTIGAIGAFLSRMFSGKIVDKYGPNIVVIPAIFVGAVCFAIIPFTHSIFILLLVAVPYGLSQGIISSVFNALILKRCSSQRRGTATAAYFSAIDIGLGVGSIFFGMIAAFLGYYFVYLGAFVFTLAAMIIYILGLAKTGKP